MLEWQSLLQTSHLCVVSGWMELLPSFLRARLSAAAVISLYSHSSIQCSKCGVNIAESLAHILMAAAPIYASTQLS